MSQIDAVVAPGDPPANKAAAAKIAIKTATKAPAVAKEPAPLPKKAEAKKKVKAATQEEAEAEAEAEAEEEEEYEVERILEERGAKYRVKWKGYSEDDATWEPKAALTGCTAVLRAWAAAAATSQTATPTCKPCGPVASELLRTESGDDTQGPKTLIHALLCASAGPCARPDCTAEVAER